MKFKRRVILKLSNHTPSRFQYWKDMQDEIGRMFEGFGLRQSDIVYESNLKKITIEYPSFEIYSEAVICVAQFSASKGLLLEQVSVENLDPKDEAIHEIKDLLTLAKESVGNIRKINSNTKVERVA